MLIRDLRGLPVKRLPAERRRRQTRYPRHARIQEGRQVALGRRITRSLHRHGQHHLPDRGPVSRSVYATRLVNELDQVQLFGHPHQRPDITDPPRGHGPRQTQIRHRRRIRRPQYRLPGEGPLPNRIPQRLRRDAVPSAAHFPLEYIHSFI